MKKERIKRYQWLIFLSVYVIVTIYFHVSKSKMRNNTIITICNWQKKKQNYFSGLTTIFFDDFLWILTRDICILLFFIIIDLFIPIGITTKIDHMTYKDILRYYNRYIRIVNCIFLTGYILRAVQILLYIFWFVQNNDISIERLKYVIIRNVILLTTYDLTILLYNQAASVANWKNASNGQCQYLKDVQVY